MTAPRTTAALGLLLLLALRAFAEEAAPGPTVIPIPYAFYTPETSLSGGVILMVVGSSTPSDPDQRDDVLRGGGFASLNGQAELFAGLEYYTPRNALRLGVETYVARYPNKFFGIGPDAATEEDYVPFECVLDGTVGFLVSPGLYLGPRLRVFGSWMQERAGSGVLIQGAVAGADGAGVIGPDARLTLDTRDSSVAPTRGGSIDLSAGWSFVAFGGSSYPTAALDARIFHSPFADRKVVLAGQLYAAWAGGTPPFQELPRLGGDKLMRGYYDGRYRDNALVAAQAEVRVPVWWRFGLAVFGSVGQVAHDPLSFRLDQTKLAGGAGLRFLVDESSGTNLRADVAFGADGADFYFNLGEAF